MDYRLGVDLGTTFTAAALRRADRIEMVTLGDRTIVTPSVIYAREDGVLVTGDAAARRSTVEVGRTARGFKRRLGDPTPLMLGETPRSVTSLLAGLLGDVMQTVVNTEGASPQGVLLTHPANWGPYRRELFDEVPRLAGLDDVQTVTEPEAAAAYYAAERHLHEGDVIAVYDLGGGTFDATVVRTRIGGMEILGSPEGIERLGGVDFDEAVLAHVDHTLKGAISRLDPRDPHEAITLHRLYQDCVEAKEILSADTDTTIPVFLPSRHTEVPLTRAEFENMIRAPIESTIEALLRAVSSARVDPAELAAVVLVGGSSRIPLVARMVSETLGRPTAVDTHPKYAVALGAATLVTDSVSDQEPPVRPAPEAVHVERADREMPQNYVAPIIPAPSRGEPVPAAPEKEREREHARATTGATEGVVQVATPARPGAPSRRGPTGPPSPPGGGPPSRPPSPPPRSATEPPSAPKRRRLDIFTRKPKLRTMLALLGVFLLAVVGVLLAFTVFHAGGGHTPAQGPARGPAPLPGGGLVPTAPLDSLATPTVTATIGLAGPQGLAISPDGKRLYVTSEGASRLSVLDIANGATIASLYLPQPPQYVAIAPDGRHAYVSSFERQGPGNVVAVLDTDTNAIVANIPVGEHPYALAVTPDGREVFVPDHNSAAVSVIDTATNTVTATIPVKPNPHWVAFTPDGRTAYVANHESNVVSVIDTTTRAVLTTIPVPKSPHSVAVSPDGRQVLETSYDAASASVIDASSNTVVGTVPVGKNPRAVVYAPDGRHAYVVNEGSDNMAVLDTSTFQITSTVPLGRSPFFIAVTGDGHLGYVTNSAANSISELMTGQH